MRIPDIVNKKSKRRLRVEGSISALDEIGIKRLSRQVEDLMVFPRLQFSYHFLIYAQTIMDPDVDAEPAYPRKFSELMPSTGGERKLKIKVSFLHYRYLGMSPSVTDAMVPIKS